MENPGIETGIGAVKTAKQCAKLLISKTAQHDKNVKEINLEWL
jgi:hypothetical protein